MENVYLQENNQKDAIILNEKEREEINGLFNYQKTNLSGILSKMKKSNEKYESPNLQLNLKLFYIKILTFFNKKNFGKKN
jgi:hypothetical protein